MIGRLNALLFAAALTATGCATMVNGRHQEVLVLSEPSGASIRLNGADVGSTPTTVRMRRRGVAVLVIDKVGYTAARISVSKRESGWMFGNLIFANPLAAQGMDSTDQWLASAGAWLVGSMTLDVLTGGGFKRPPVVTVTLAPLPGVAVDPKGQATAQCDAQTPAGCSPPDARPNRPTACSIAPAGACLGRAMPWSWTRRHPG